MNENELKEALIRQLEEFDRAKSHGPRYRELKAKLKERFGIDWDERNGG